MPERKYYYLYTHACRQGSNLFIQSCLSPFHFFFHHSVNQHKIVIFIMVPSAGTSPKMRAKELKASRGRRKKHKK
jgi:hypothetical protein